MAITGTQINTKVGLILQDATNIRWTTSEMCGWINSAQREIIIYKPNANPVTEAMVTVAGTKQSIPTSGIQLLEVIRNMGTNGTTAGNAITNINRNILDVTIPDWHTASASASSKHFCFDERIPQVFYLYPPQPTSSMGYVEVCYSKLPTDLTESAGSISGSIFNDLYETVIIDYVLYRAYSKDSEHTANAQQSIAHYQAFVAALTGKTQSEVMLAPDQRFSSAKATSTGR
jgi:hypothetical protein